MAGKFSGEKNVTKLEIIQWSSLRRKSVDRDKSVKNWSKVLKYNQFEKRGLKTVIE